MFDSSYFSFCANSMFLSMVRILRLSSVLILGCENICSHYLRKLSILSKCKCIRIDRNDYVRIEEYMPHTQPINRSTTLLIGRGVSKEHEKLLHRTRPHESYVLNGWFQLVAQANNSVLVPYFVESVLSIWSLILLRTGLIQTT